MDRPVRHRHGSSTGEMWNLPLVDVHVDGDAPYVNVRFGSEGKTPKNGKTRKVPLFGLGLEAAREWITILPAYAPSQPARPDVPAAPAEGRDRREARLEGRVTSPEEQGAGFLDKGEGGGRSPDLVASPFGTPRRRRCSADGGAGSGGLEEVGKPPRALVDSDDRNLRPPARQCPGEGRGRDPDGVEPGAGRVATKLPRHPEIDGEYNDVAGLRSRRPEVRIPVARPSFEGVFGDRAGRAGGALGELRSGVAAAAEASTEGAR